MEGMLSSEAAVDDSHKAHIAVAASDDKSFAQRQRLDRQIQREARRLPITGFLAYCCSIGLRRRYLFVVFPAVFIMRGGRHNCDGTLDKCSVLPSVLFDCRV
jgi:hypothetical protein